MKNILVIDNYDSFVYNLVQLLREHEGCTFDVVYNDQIDFQNLYRYDKLLLSPGAGIPEKAGQLLQLIEQCYRTHSILGVCLGHQAIAQYFGAQLQQIPYPKHGHASRLHTVDATDVLLQNMPADFIVGRYHSWTILPESMPDVLRISSLDEDGNIMSYYHATLPIHGFQFHPESIITENGKRLLHNWINR